MIAHFHGVPISSGFHHLIDSLMLTADTFRRYV